MTSNQNRDIVVICLDSVRKDFFDRAASRIIEQADVSFEQCRAASMWSAPSHASMISGLLPHEHGVHTHAKHFDSLPVEKTIFDDLDGYRTVGISGNTYAGPAYGFDEYFDRFEVLGRPVRHPEGLDPRRTFSEYDNQVQAFYEYVKRCLSHPHTLKSLHNGLFGFADFVFPGDLLSRIYDHGARRGLKIAQQEVTDSSDPTFVFLNLMETHIHYQPTLYLDSDLYECPWNWSTDEKNTWDLYTGEYDEQYWEWRNQLYEANIEYLDRCIDDFLTGVPDETTVVVTSDHGDNLGTETDNRLADHRTGLTEGLLHVPLVVINPPNRVVETRGYVSHLRLPDLINTVRDGRVSALGERTVHAEVIGLSPGPEPDRRYDYHDRMIRSAYRDAEKIVWDSRGGVSRYRLDYERPNWQTHLEDLASVPGWCTTRFQEDIQSYKKRAHETEQHVAVDEVTKERLETLGYR